MALIDRDIIITPNKGAATEPTIRFTGADASASAAITLRVINSSTVGTLSFEGNSGQLFSMTDTMSGTIFTVNDVSGIPSIEVLDTGVIKLAQYGGYVYVAGTTNAVSTVSGVFQVHGGAGIGGNLYAGSNVVVQGTTNASSTITGALQVYGGAGIGGNLYVGGTLNAASVTGTITNTTNVGVTNDTASATAQYLTFVSGSSGNLPIKVAATTGLVYIPSSGNLGIGTTSPIFKLDVAGGIRGQLPSNLDLGALGAKSSIYARASRYTPTNSISGTDINDTANGANIGYVTTFNAGWTGWAWVGRDRGFSTGFYDVYVRIRTDGAGNSPTGVGFGIYNNTLANYLLSGTTLTGLSTTYKEVYAGRFELTEANLGQSIGTYFSSSGITTNYYVDYIRFDPSPLFMGGRVGIGVTNPLSGLHVVDRATGHSGEARIGGSTTAFGVLITYDQGSATSGTIYASPAYASVGALLKLGVGSGNTNQLVLKGDGYVGIGTASPAASLHIAAENNGNDGTLKLGGRAWLQHRDAGNTTTSLINDYSSDSAKIDFRIKSTSNVIVTMLGSGNVGIGKAAPAAKLHVYNNSAIWGYGTGDYLVKIDNDYNDSSYKGLYVRTNYSGQYGTIAQFSDYSGDRMTIKAGGNVGIGTDIPSDALHIRRTDTTLYNATIDDGQFGTGAGITVSNQDDTTVGTFAQLNLHVSANSGRAVARIVAIRMASATSDLAFVTESANVKAEKMRITAAGNVGIGTTAPIAKFEVSGSSGQLFSVVDSFVGTIFSVNDVSGIPSIEVLDTGLIKLAQYTGQVAISTSTAQSGFALTTWGNMYVNSSTYIVKSLGVGTGPSGVAGEIRAANEITAYYTSDERLKENVVLIGNPIEKLMQIRGVSFDWTEEHIISKGGEDGYFVRKHDVGVIAQEIEKVLPEIVATRNNGYKAVKYEKIVPLLIECIKEQQTQINQILARLEMLNIK